jgi:sugar transferase (PEP-CTERM system associated)
MIGIWKYLALRKLGAVFLETLLLMCCVLAAYGVRMQELPIGRSAIEQYQILPKAILIALVFQLSLHLNDIYNFHYTQALKEYIIRLAQALFMATLVLSVIFFVNPVLVVGRGIFILSLIFSAIFLIIWRTLLRMYFGKRHPSTNLVVLGTGTLARDAVKEILQRPELGIRVLGFVDDSPQLLGVSIINPKVIGNYEDLPKLVADHKVDRIVVGLPDRRGKLPIKDLLDLKTKGVAIEEVATFYERVAGKIPLENLKPSWMVFNSGFTISRQLLIEKRIISIVASFLLMLLCSPIILLLMALIKLDSKGPVFYRQKRVGQDGKVFVLWKFRSMVADAEVNTGPVWSDGAKKDPRITRIGKFMRRNRLDELPQLFNVFKGDMSFVGPRPERPNFVQQLSDTIPFYSLRHVVKPGITGWAQINYGYANTLDHTIEKLQYDLFYIKNMSWILDALIMLQTVKTVLVKEGS